MAITIDAALGGFWDDIGALIERAGQEDASGARRYVVQMVGQRRDDEVMRYLRCSKLELDGLKARMIAVMGPIPESKDMV